jgi:S-adenosyl-L-methionine hydrolase (adenosine-forming)
MPNTRLVTFTTDFGLNDHYVGTMRGVITNINPNAHIIDISNNVQSFDILDGALTISEAYHYFAADTVHVVIVDPGVGTNRRPIIAQTERHVFLAPDNGVLSLVYEREERLTVRHITSEHYFLQPVSPTFQGRDIFAAVAGWLSKGVEPAKFGEEIADFVRFSTPRPKVLSPTQMKAVVLKVDKFGNLITNIAEKDVPTMFGENPPAFKLNVGRGEITKLKRTFADGSVGEIFAVVGSMGFIELVANRGNASIATQAGKGAEIQVAFADPQFANVPTPA